MTAQNELLQAITVLIGADAVAKLCADFGGRQLYIPADKTPRLSPAPTLLHIWGMALPRAIFPTELQFRKFMATDSDRLARATAQQTVLLALEHPADYQSLPAHLREQIVASAHLAGTPRLADHLQALSTAPVQSPAGEAADANAAHRSPRPPEPPTPASAPAVPQ
jgi:hypothetical protein